MGVGSFRTHPSRLTREQSRVVELRLVGEDVRVRVCGDRERALTDELAGAGPRHTAQVEERDAPMPQVVRREQRNGRGLACLRDRRPQRVRTGVRGSCASGTQTSSASLPKR
jgi:hypothetical protein